MNSRSGQSLVEVLIAIAIGALIIGAAVGAINITLRSNVSNVARIQGIPVAQELIEEVRTISEGKWNDIYNLQKGEAFDHFIAEDNGQIVIAGQESVLTDEVKNGLVGHWKFDESSGDVVYDFSGGDLNGSFSLAAPPGRPLASECKVSRCLSFDGTDGTHDLATVPDSAELDAVFGSSNKVFTLSAWAFPTAWVNYSTILNKATGGSWSNTTVGLWSYTGGFRCVIGSNVGGNPAGSYVGVENRPTLSIWHHVACVSDGSTLKIYINGLQTGSVAIPGSVDPTSNDSALTIGRRCPGCNESFPGKMDDIRVYNRVLSDSEVAQLSKSQFYTRSFHVEDVYRDGNGNIVSDPTGFFLDPNTQRVIVDLEWNGGSSEISQYFARLRNDVTNHTDWSDNSEFVSSGGIDNGTPGEIKLFE